MDLFTNEKINLLPHDGEVSYYGKIMSDGQADKYLDLLLKSIDWKNDEALLFGKRIITKRKVAWYGEMDFEYSYSNVQKKAIPWTPALLELKTLTERLSGDIFNSCLLNLYHNGSEGVAWHSDGEKDLKKDGAIGSLSFGAERRFLFKHKQSMDRAEVILEHGSLLVMKGTTQTHWLHRLPTTKRISLPRVNLTFRTIVNYETPR